MGCSTAGLRVSSQMNTFHRADGPEARAVGGLVDLADSQEPFGNVLRDSRQHLRLVRPSGFTYFVVGCRWIAGVWFQAGRQRPICAGLFRQRSRRPTSARTVCSYWLPT